MKSASQSIKNVKIPDGEWLTLIEGAAYTRTGYARFTEAAKRKEFPMYAKPGASQRQGKVVRKSDLDNWVMGGGAN